MAEKILVIEDDPAFRAMLAEALHEKGYEGALVGSAEEGVARLKKELFDLVITDVMLPGMSGIEALSLIKQADPALDVIVMTAHSTRDSALEAVRRGAYDYFTKPFSLNEMEIVIRRALERRALRAELSALKNSLSGAGRVPVIVGQSPAMLRLIEMVQRVAALDTTVLITGESGTGKEVVADAIQAYSKRAAERFIKVNCAAIPETLLESELYGHEKGAYTGAVSLKKGKFELAHKGTILLDELGDMPLSLQPKLLRAVEQRVIERLGGGAPIDIDVRIIAATNQELAKLIEEKKFRADLYYRLSVATVNLPPLRERKEDLPALAAHFLEKINPKTGTDLRGLSREAMALLFDYDWPGNIRQLANVLERAAITSRGDVLTESDIRQAFENSPRAGVRESAPRTGTLRENLRAFERTMIADALRQASGVQTEAARLLGVSPKNLWNKIQKHRLGQAGA
ncbi:MAG: sigma-54-dependent Fis family transcriptional regulator [Desulfovibrionaceae bacterium]|nr:sigma-54-dependent Fis family transcriptional regulator [Desulfovibrionaceae bacterium]MBF0512895.1 sigma-54-dependent Fis family transcriptional regulator [Desulfovibrionaceae bacterium]